ncbi:hypothetical protein V3N99_11785 [Dermatophilaceae bacterium Soc4.6]
MLKIYIVLVVLVAIALVTPTIRRSLGGLGRLRDRDGRRELTEQAKEAAGRAADTARTAAGTARDAAGTAAGVAIGTASTVRGAGESVAQGLTDRRLRTLGRSLTIEGDAVTVGPFLTAAAERVAVVDAVAVQPGEALAWLHSGSGDTRYAARPGPTTMPTTVFGVVGFDYAYGEPQGMSAAGEFADAVTSALTEAGVRWTEAVLTFEPGPDDSSDGPRRLA